MESEEKIEDVSKMTLVGHMFRGVLISVVILLIDSLMLWGAWTFILQQKFTLPSFSPWEVVGLLATYRLVFNKKG